MKLIKRLLLLIPITLPFLLISCGEDKEISPGHYQGPKGGTYTISSTGKKEYFGNNSGSGSIPVWLIAIFVVIGIVMLIIVISAFIRVELNKDIYIDPLANHRFCSRLNCNNKFFYSSNRKLCDVHSKSTNRVNITSGQIEHMKKREEHLADEMALNKRLINNTIKKQGYFSTGRGSFFSYLKAKQHISFDNGHMYYADVEVKYYDLKEKYFDDFIKTKYR